MNWTKEQPTTPGWYWRRRKLHREVVEVISGAKKLWVVNDSGIHSSIDGYASVAEWAGPIPEPGEVATKPISSPDTPATCGECGIRGPACYPRAATDKACKEGRKA